MLFLTKSDIIPRVSKRTRCENLKFAFDVGSSTNPSNHIATERMLPLFRAVVKFCSTNRLFKLAHPYLIRPPCHSRTLLLFKQPFFRSPH